jgi:toxin CcdB
MAQFDIYENNEPESKDIIPFLLDVQHDLHGSLSTRMVVPLISSYSVSNEIKKLCPVLKVMGKNMMMSTPEMAGYPVRDLGVKVESAANQRTEIINAIDFLLGGF